MKRKSGVLMHVSSLPGEYSIGSFGDEALAFIDKLCEGGFSVWQVLPFCMTDECNSPYKSYSAFGANPYFIDLPTLYKKGYITKEELNQARQNTPYLTEYKRLSEERIDLLRLAAKRASEDKEAVKSINDFLSDKEELRSAAEFLSLREANENSPWQKWTVYTPDENAIFFWRFVQYEFFTEWQKIKEYANEKGIEIIGDVPIYVALDSADVWAHPEQFKLDKDNIPTAVAGVPPDYFSEDGQLWNNPLYDWGRMKKDGFSWWRRRIEHMLTLFDGVRIDHFRGIEAYWSIPAGAKSAKEGKWVKGPGRAFVNMVKEVAKDKLIIAEDLGDITDGVRALLDYSGFPGMRVMQFAFLGDEKTPHLPHNYTENSVAYTGTHDNNTLLGYIWEMSADMRSLAFDYCGYYGEDFNKGEEALLRTVMRSSAAMAIFPIQDLLCFGADTRMNTPGVADGNWAYRVTNEQLDSLDLKKFYYLNRLYGRVQI